jgi:hypothetical protein
MKNFVELQLPGCDSLFVVLRVVTPGDHIPFTPLDEEIARRTHHRLNSRRQFLNRLEDRSIELFRSPWVDPLIKGFADVGAS